MKGAPAFMIDIAAFTPRHLAGQRIMAGFDGTTLNDNLKFLIHTVNVGGIILFARNIIDRPQLRDLCASAQDYAAACGLPPLFIAIDQEGGVVARLKAPHFIEFPGNPAIRNIGDAKNFALAASRELMDMGINMNMAPVMDVAPPGFPSIMEKRMFANEPTVVSQLGAAVIETLQSQGIMAVAKHFPGIGRTTIDSHLDLPETDLSGKDLDEFELIPFAAAIRADVCGIMFSHIRYRQIDSQWPASLSVKIASELLRHRMGFDGITMTDDLDMGAIKNHYDLHIAVSRVLASDIDMALICHQGPDIETAHAEIMAHISTDEAMDAACRRSVKRIMRWKTAYLSKAATGATIKIGPGAS
jgi:beta-N-acetylhexosaminidase